MTDTPKSYLVSAPASTAVGYSISLSGPMGWFGPGQSMQPAAQEVIGRQYDFASGFNTQTLPRQDENLSAAALRDLVEACDVLKLVIQTRKDQLSALKGSFQLKEKTKSGQKADPRLAMLNEFFEMPDQEHDFETWLGALLDDLFTIDAPTLYPDFTQGGAIYAFQLVDGGSITRKLDGRGRMPLPPHPAYQQVFKGMAAVDYTRDQLIYMPRTVRTFRAYGQSPVQQVVMTVNTAIRRALMQLEHYTSGTVPEAILGVPDNWTPDQLRKAQDDFNQMLSGNTSARRRVHIVNKTMADSFTQLREAALKDEFDEWLARVVCYAFSVSPQAFVKMMNRGSGETQQAMANAEGLAPLQRWVKRLLARCVKAGWGWTDIEWGWAEEEETDPAEQATTSTTYAKIGALTINEVRADIGREPIEGGDVPMIITATGGVPLLTAAEPPPPPAASQQIGHNGGPPLEDGKSDPGTEAMKEEELLKAAGEKAEGRLQGMWEHFLGHAGQVAARRLAPLAPGESTVTKAKGDDADAPPPSDDVLDAAIDQALREMAWPTIQASTAEVLGSIASEGVAEGGDALAAIAGISVQSNPKGGGGSPPSAILEATKLADPRAVASAQTQAAQLITGVTETTRDGLKRLIVQAIDEGWPAQKLADAMVGNYAFSPARAMVIARYEAAKARNTGKIESWRQSNARGLKTQKRVVLGMNENHCLACSSAVAEGPIPIEESWTAGFQSPFHPSCYCTLVPFLPKT